MTNIEKAKLDPSSIYRRPADVLKDNTLSRQDKIDVLRSWAYDEREKEVAEEENMLSIDSNNKDYLDEILKTLHQLGIEGDQTDPPPTKHG
ncbi:MAG: putative cytosolic protein [uncultured bacterium]|nr:MAG: putative cytosolic protein [uncultured bacterium]